MILIKNVRLLGSDNNKLYDILVVKENIAAVGENLDINGLRTTKMDMQGALCTSGLIDIHVHTSGGGGKLFFFH